YGSAFNRAGEWFAVPAHAHALIRALLIERAGDDVNPQAPLFTGRSDSRIVEAAIVRHGGGAPREDLALALKWPLERLELALRTLERRLQATGLGLAKQAGTAHAGAIGDRGVRGD